ncbi:hypothetical protein CMQ_3606 [Grosmannia clavigera kw1407]|uniref:Uncharacterized protein n=1 Tax=Grosmannia clavigera (strain kw1407 / UAMH 11150) TaxID=655863 RepID=F0X932_GROCL|nr:uncharacterized protein CMQ_3606 [Grosmannia clavigera kw1407]EFX05537.1 hypothetical protein CMQ_3606 [Grosmannia clavigera kw1407]
MTVFVGVPLLVCLCVICTSPPLRAIGCVLGDRARLRAWLRGAVRKLRDKTRPTVDWIVDTIAPFIFGVTLVLTTSVGIVLYGIGHVGIATAARSGILGIDLATVRTLVRWLWRLLIRFNWAWGLRTVFGWERRHRRHQEERLHRHDEDLLLHDCGCPHRHLGDHLHDCVLRRHHYRNHDLGSELHQPWHDHHGWQHQYHHQQLTQNSLTEEELTELEQKEYLETRRELLRIRLQRRGILTQTDGSSAFERLGFGSDYRDFGTQTGSPRNTYRHPSPFPAPMPSPELGEIPPRQPPVRWQPTVEDEPEAEARENEAEESEWRYLQVAANNFW